MPRGRSDASNWMRKQFLPTDACPGVCRFIGHVFIAFRPLWPWLVSAVIFRAYLATSQGKAIALEMATKNWLTGTSGLVLCLSFLCSLAACLFTSLVVAHRPSAQEAKRLDSSDSREVTTRRDERVQGAARILASFLCALAPATMLLSAAGYSEALLVGMLVLAISIAVVHRVLQGSWKSAEHWSIRMNEVHKHRFLIALAIVLIALLPLWVGAQTLVSEPTSFSRLGPVFVALLGLSSVATLFGAVFVSLPYCTAYPRTFIALGVGWVVSNLAVEPISDPGNPLLKTEIAATRASLSERTCPVERNIRRTLVDRAQRVRSDETKAGRIPELFFVSAEGGGIRAAYWTAIGLAGLDESTENFSSKLASMSGVSGGSLGIATWLAAVEATDDRSKRRRYIEDFLGSDFLSPAVGGLLFLDAPRLVLGPLWFEARRDHVFELALVRKWASIAGPSSNFFLRPMVNPCFEKLRNPPVINFVATDAVVGEVVASGNMAYSLPGGKRRFINSLLVESNMFASPVVHAVVMSARFPFLSPTEDVGINKAYVEQLVAENSSDLSIRNRAGEVGPHRPEEINLGSEYLRLGVLVDGGYFDNSGMVMTREMLALLDARQVPPPGVPYTPSPRRTDDVAAHVVHFSNDPDGLCVEARGWEAGAHADVVKLIHQAKFRPVCQLQVDELNALFTRRWFGWLTGPIEAIYNVRDGHALQERRHMGRLVATRPVPGAFVDFSLRTELSRSICASRGDDENECRNLSRVFGSARGTSPPASSGDSRCEKLRLSTPPPLGWVLGLRDRQLMDCLSSTGTRVAEAHLVETAAAYKKVTEARASARDGVSCQDCARAAQSSER